MLLPSTSQGTATRNNRAMDDAGTVRPPADTPHLAECTAHGVADSGGVSLSLTQGA